MTGSLVGVPLVPVSRIGGLEGPSRDEIFTASCLGKPLPLVNARKRASWSRNDLSFEDALGRETAMGGAAARIGGLVGDVWTARSGGFLASSKKSFGAFVTVEARFFKSFVGTAILRFLVSRVSFLIFSIKLNLFAPLLPVFPLI
jgi:hypothetical protein